MADLEPNADVQLLKNTRISVVVEQALQDLLVVSYELGVHIFRGVLLDSTKKNLPCGIATLNPAFNTKGKPEDDPLYSANQRYAYTDPSLVKKTIRSTAKVKSGRMTVRLRPRQVLCSKCKGICNENSENVSKKRKTLESSVPPPQAKRSANAPITRSVVNEGRDKADRKNKSFELMPSLIPKISRLLPQEISDALEGNVERLNEIDEKSKKGYIALKNADNSCAPQGVKTELKENATEEADILVSRSGKRTLRKKRSVGSMEDLWDESVFEEGKNTANVANTNGTVENSAQTCTSTRTIKISYGPQGEGTVLKIPAPIEQFPPACTDDFAENATSLKAEPFEDKATRKALKRAKKKAKHRMRTTVSPNYISVPSPRYSVGGSSPRYAISTSPRHYIGNNSPRYVNSTLEMQVTKRHKHKMKRKKRHRDEKERKHKDSDDNSSKEENIATHKFSINLKRLQDTFVACARDGENTSSSDEHNELVPNFPPSSPSLITQTVPSAIGADGRKLLVGDVVWGKIRGFPWWPGKVLTISCAQNQAQQAHVSWYGSSTSSVIECDQLSSYLDNFKMRYNKKKKGAYKDAIKQATTDAKEVAASTDIGDVVVKSPPHIMTVPLPALASPREIDVMS